MPTRPELEDARRRLQKALNEAGTEKVLKELAHAALGLKKRVRHEFVCKSCNKPQWHYVEVSDPVGAAKAFQVLADQANGRPQEEQQETGLTVNITYVLTDEDDDAGA